MKVNLSLNSNLRSFSLVLLASFFAQSVMAQREYANAETNTKSSGCASCVITNPTNVVNPSSLTDFTVYDVTLAVGNGFLQQILQFPTAGNAGDTVVIAIQDPDGQLDASTLGGLRVYMMNGATQTADSLSVQTPTLTVINGTSGIFGIVIRPTETYDRVMMRFTNVVGMRTKVNVYYAFKAVAPPDNSSCQRASKTTYSYAAGCAACTVINPTLAVDVEDNSYSTLSVDISAAGAYTSQMLDFGSVSPGGDVITLILENPAGVLNAAVLGNLTFELYNGAVGSGQNAINQKNIRAIPGTNKYEYYYNVAGVPYTKGELRLNGGYAGGLNELRIYYVCRSTKNPIEPTLCDVIADVQQTLVSGTTGGSVTNAGSAVDGNFSTGSLLDIGNFSASGFVQQTLYFPKDLAPGDSLMIKVENPAGMINAGTMGNVVFSTELNGNPNNDPVTFNRNGLNVADGSGRYVFVVRPVKAFDAVQIRLNAGTASSLVKLEVYEACVHEVAKVFSLVKCQTGSSQVSNTVGTMSSVINPDNAIDMDPDNFSTLNVDLAANGYAEQLISFPNPGCAGDVVNVILEEPAGLLDVYLQGNVSVNSFTGTGIAPTHNADVVIMDQSNIRLMDGTIRFVFTFKPIGPFNGVRVRLTGGTVGAVSSVHLYEASFYGIDPPVSKDTTICYGSAVTLLATAVPGAQIDWYNAPSGGTSLATGGTYTSAPLTDTTIFYLQSTRVANSCANLCRVPVTVNVRQQIVIPVMPDKMVVCKGDSTTVAPVHPDVSVFRFYPDSNSTTPITEGSEYVTSKLYTDTSIFVCGIKDGCESIRKRIFLDVVDRTPDPVVADTSICAENQAVLIVTGPAGADIFWYKDATGGFPLVQNDTFVTPVLYKDTVFYVESFLTLCGTSDNRLPVYVSVAPLPPLPVIDDTLYFCGDIGTLLITSGSPTANYGWYTTLEGGSPQFTGNPYVVNLITDTTIFYVQTEDYNCQSHREPVVAISNVVPTEPVISDTLICSGQPITLVPDTTVYSSATFNWYSSPTATTPVATTKTFNTPIITGTTTYWLETQLSDCVSGRVPVTITTQDPLQAPVITCDTTNQSTNSVTFNWNTVSGASGYMVSTDSGQTWTPVTGTSYTAPSNGQDVSIMVIALGSAPCGNSASSTPFACSPQGCAPTDFETDEDLSICSGENLVLSVTNIQTPQYLIEWNGNAPTTDTFYTVNPSTPTSYIVKVYNPNQPGCDTTVKVINVGIDPNPVADFTMDKDHIIVPDGQVSFHENTVGSVQWHWEFGDGNTSSEQNPVHTYTTSDTFTVMLVATNVYGCSDTTTRTLVADDAFNIFIPNSFTPNKDQKNDVLYVRGKSVQAVFFRLYNQWGQLLFETDNLSKGWDGTFNGEEQPVGVYVYYCDAVSNRNEKIAKKGSITLIR